MTHTLRSPRKSSASEAVEDKKKERRQPTPSSSSTGPERGQKRSRAQGLLRTSGPAVQLGTGQPVLQRQAGERKTDTGTSVKDKTSSGQKSTTETPNEQGKPTEGKKSMKDVVQSKGKGTTGEKSKGKKSTGEKSSESKESSDSGGVCALTTYSTTNFTGEDITADTEFTDSLDTIDGYASTEGVKVHVTDSFRAKGETPKGTVVEPATKSNHLAGHAIDMNVRGDDGKFYNSDKLAPSKLSEASEGVRSFIQSIENDSNLRWGGNFSNTDPVHIDDHLNASTSAWKKRYKATQKAYDNDCY